ncbi:phospho-sugar mutase [Nocardia donostiensis]|uniref:Phosphomannomutase n=1 Tax=Nocardia donostiensis TaxID=1538463 RepID=A0A1V2TC03_9NOCA|nr:phospho-sugar mutase [Nocardia donostiensis]ONM47036.1 phosphomannomutase [Nocardia donostiensis]OQS14592.1 phosphomannomutase [Nocardia donostiensis]OQS18786.1 phosphomannomutase [Nocardia donostiensis]
MLRFGTAGLRGPLQDGPDGMNVTTVGRATAGLARWLQDRCLGGGRVVVGRDARHGSAEFATVTAEIFAGAGFAVTLLPEPLPTPVTAFAVRELGAVAGVQITASHNPASDNGYKVYLDGGVQLLAPADTEIEGMIEAVAEPIARAPVAPSGADLLPRYLDRMARLPKLIGGPGARAAIRIALTPLHGVGGPTAVEALAAAGFTDVHVVEEQFAPDPDFPTVAFPNPEELGATDLLLDLARRVNADIAIALDPDADRCAVGVRGPEGIRMLRGDETGVLLADYVLATAKPDALVATTIVSSRLLSRLAPARGARYAETLTGFKWLARAGDGLVYAYEEAIGHCVDPAMVRDKDGISAAVAAADLVAQRKAQGRTLFDQLDNYALEFGVHAGDQVSLRLPDATAAAAVLDRLRAEPPREIAGTTMSYTDLAKAGGRMRTDALIFADAGARIVVRPSGTEPKLKCYLEVVEPVSERAALGSARTSAEQRLSRLRQFCRDLAS